jgi:hypothetical protein
MRSCQKIRKQRDEMKKQAKLNDVPDALKLAIKRAFKICIRNGSPISDFLIEKRRELSDTMMFEFTNKDAGALLERAKIIRYIAEDNNGDYEVAARSVRMSVADAKHLVEYYQEEIDAEEIDDVDDDDDDDDEIDDDDDEIDGDEV